MNALQVAAPAKLNLFLHVCGRRPDGYHDIETLFQLIDLADQVDIELRDDGAIRREPPPSDALLKELPDAADLSVRAALLLQQRSGTRLGANLHVRKRIPAGGGLGGGSSDAAAVLQGLNRLWKLDWPAERLAALGVELGADVPVFVYGRNAFATGRGEVLTPVVLAPRWYFILHPGVMVSTAEVFADPQLTRDTPARRIPPASKEGRNDCEPVVRRRHPEVAAALDWLGERAASRLTGTGSCVFAVMEDEKAASSLLEALPRQWTGFVARGLE